jgi:methylmalonyl-CoA mutase N-terminal domain/subunit
METLTKDMEEKILEEMENVEKMGGMVEAVASGYVQREVARQAYEYEKHLQEGKVTKVGVNKYTEGIDMEVELHEHNEQWARLQIERLKELKTNRDNKSVMKSLKCCKCYATVGEMANVFRDVFGELKEPSIF